MAAQLKIALRRFLFSVSVEYILSYLFKFPSNLIGSSIDPPSRIGVVLERRADGFVRNDFLCCHLRQTEQQPRERADFATGQATVRTKECRSSLWTAVLRFRQRGEFHISHDASRQIFVFSPRWKERSRVSREIFNDLNFKMQLIQGKFEWALLIFGIWLIM